MAQFNYYSTIDEWWIYLDVILKERDVRFVIDQPYSESHCESFAALNEGIKEAILASTRRVFLIGEAFSDGPLLFRQQNTGLLAGKHFIDLARGSPFMEFIMPAQFIEDDLTWFSEGNLFFQKLFWNEQGTAAYPAPKVLKDAYGLIKRTLQRHLTQQKLPGGEKIWVSPAAWQMFLASKAGLPGRGKCYMVNGEVPFPRAWRHPK